MKEIKAIIRTFMLPRVLDALAAIDDLPGVTVSEIIGWGKSRAANEEHRVEVSGHALAKRTKLEIVVSDDLATPVAEAIATAARTGRPGDGKIFVYAVDHVVKIRTGETGPTAI